jgi:hypothetical protein
MDMSNLTTPREIDLALAAKHHELDKAEQQLAYSNDEMFRMAGAKYVYRGRKRVPDMSLTEAIEKANENVQALRDYMEANAYEENGYHGVRWHDYNGVINSYDSKRALEAFDKRNERIEECVRIQDEIRELQNLYTGWSRFFLVTSSPGHVHSSMHCSSCRPTTTYGWLPELSDKSEDEAVAELGPSLCSVCFSSAPTEHIGGKITAAKAAKLAA